MKNNSSDKKQIVKPIGKQGNKKTSEKHNRKNQKPVENGKMSESKGYPCPYFKKCGGCRLLNMSYEEQLKHKQSTVAKNLKDIASAQGVKISKIVPAEQPFYYRNKVHSVFTRNGLGKVIRGIYREETHKVVNVSGCLIENEIADSIIEEVKRLLPSFKYKVYDETDKTGWLRHVLVRVGKSESGDPESDNIMLVLVTATVPFTGKNNFVKAIRTKYPQIKTIIQNINDKNTDMILGERNIVCYGPGYIEDCLLGLKFRISPGSFYQVNHAQAENLYRIAGRMAAPGKADTVIDAYCGTGTIGMSMAAAAKEVVGVELNGDAVKDAVYNARANAINNIRFIKADATEWMRGYKAFTETDGQKGKKTGDSEILIMDPPRAGSTQEFVDAATALRFKRIVYVSCNPETLARDLKWFIAKGYKPEEIVPVDMFPWTVHVETVCLLVLRNDITHINIDVDVEELVRDKRGQATYDQIRDFVKEQTGLHVSNLNIAQIKQKCGIIERENYNLPKSEDARQPNCTEDKEEAITKAFEHFGLI